MEHSTCHSIDSVLIKIVTTQMPHSLRKITLSYVGLHLDRGCRKSQELEWPEDAGCQGQGRMHTAAGQQPNLPRMEAHGSEASQLGSCGSVTVFCSQRGTMCRKHSASINTTSVHTPSLSLSHFHQRSTLPIHSWALTGNG